jgi:hypothetical protein
MRIVAWIVWTLFVAFVAISLVGGIYEASNRSPEHTLGLLGVFALMLAAIWAGEYLDRPRR